MTNYENTQPYGYSIAKDLSRHIIPPPTLILDEDKRSIFIVERGADFSLGTDKYGDPQFLSDISRCQPLRVEHVMGSWQYHQKGTAQDVFPFLLIGPMMIARDPDFIKSNGITMLLAVRDGKAVSINSKIMDPARFASAKGMETATFDPLDSADMIHRFPSVLKRMIEHLKEHTGNRVITQLGDIHGKILVFCEAGDKRSAAVVVLFVMVVFGLSALRAVQVVQARRYCIAINGELYRMLENCEAIIKAEQQVAAELPLSERIPQALKHHSAKRNISQFYDPDDQMDFAIEDFGLQRIGNAPFKDMEF